MRIAEVDAKKAKQTASEIKLACDAVHLFQTEYTMLPEVIIDLSVPLSDATKLLAATTPDERLLFASNVASTTITSLSGVIADTGSTIGPTQYPKTRLFLEENNKPIQSLHESLALRLRQISPHLATMLHGAKASLEDAINPLRSANVANNLRELHREILEILAPDNAVMKARWFIPDKTSKNGVTRRHRLMYALYNYVSASSFPSAFVSIADSQMDEVLNTLGALSKFTHTTSLTLAAGGPAEVQLYNRFLSQLTDVLGTIERSRDILRDGLESILQRELSSLFVNYTFSSLDELSSHTRPEGADDILVKIESITPDNIIFLGTGRVSIDLQFGSDGDCRRGDGLESSDSYPFTYRGTASTVDIKKINVKPEDVHVDTSSYYE